MYGIITRNVADQTIEVDYYETLEECKREITLYRDDVSWVWNRYQIIKLIGEEV